MIENNFEEDPEDGSDCTAASGTDVPMTPAKGSFLRSRLYTPADYSTCVEWWKGHGVPAVVSNVLSPLGVVMEDETGPIAVCWVYLALSCGLVLGPAWLTTKPVLSGRYAARVVRALVNAAKVVVPPEYGLMVALPQQDSYARLLRSEGFIFNHKCSEMFFLTNQPTQT